MDVNLRVQFVGFPPAATDDDFEEFLELVIDELERIGRHDIEMTASLASKNAVFTVFGSEATPSVDTMLADVRTALHAASCATPGWERADLRLDAEGPFVVT